MKQILLHLMCILIGIEASSQSDKQEAKHHFWSAALFYDQDYTLEQLGLPSLNEDRNYTMGLGIFLSFRSLKKCPIYAPHYFLNKLMGKATMNDRHGNDDNIINSMMIANGSFTPDSLPAYYPIRNDRPYASLTYLQTIITRLEYTHNSFRHYVSTVSIGLLGTAISREVQTAIHTSQNNHDTKNPRTPRGWGNQISNGGEPTINYSLEEERLLTSKALRLQQKTSVGGIEIKHGWKYSLGYYTLANYALNFRLGQKDPRNWAYLVNPLGSSNNLAYSVPRLPEFENNKEVRDYYDCRNTFEIYLFGSLRPTFVLYNALLNGQFRKSEHILTFHDMRHLLLEFDGGGAISIPIRQRNLLEVKLRMSGRSPEFALPGRSPRWHYWGGIDVSFSHR